MQNLPYKPIIRDDLSTNCLMEIDFSTVNPRLGIRQKRITGHNRQHCILIGEEILEKVMKLCPKSRTELVVKYWFYQHHWPIDIGSFPEIPPELEYILSDDLKGE